MASVGNLFVRTPMTSVWTAGNAYTPLMTNPPKDGIDGVSSRW
jgi:hypothetical protein